MENKHAVAHSKVLVIDVETVIRENGLELGRVKRKRACRESFKFLKKTFYEEMGDKIKKLKG